MSAEYNVLEAAIAWYNYVLRTRDNLSSDEQRLFDAVNEFKKMSERNLLSHLPKPIESFDKVDERPTTPVPDKLQTKLINKSKSQLPLLKSKGLKE